MEALIGGDKYIWEKSVNQWDGVHEDDQGNIVAFHNERERSHRAKARRVTTSIRRGLIRYLVIAVDCSSSALEKDFRPNRFEAIKSAVQSFIPNYFDQNPISQLCLAISNNGVAEKLTELSGNPKYHENILSNDIKLKGDASLQNVLNLSINILKNIPEYGTREVLIVYNSLKTRDPGNIFESIQEAIKSKLRVNIVCNSAELFICKKISEDTGGSFAVATDANHLRELVLNLVTPPPELKDRRPLTTEFVYMGFPRRNIHTNALIAVDGTQPKYTTSSYVCPRCFCRSTDLPTQCSICRLQLTSSAHIARSHHHLFPVPNFTEVQLMPVTVCASTALNDTDRSDIVVQIKSSCSNSAATITPNATADERVTKLPQEASSGVVAQSQSANRDDITVVQYTIARTKDASQSNLEINNIESGDSQDNRKGETVSVSNPTCAGCFQALKVSSLALLCPNCTHLFCVDCDLFIHDSLHNCPGCH